MLILESFSRDASPWGAIPPAFKTELAQQLPAPLEFHEAALDTARAEAPEAEAAFAAYLHTLYAKREPNLVALIGGPAAQYWWRHRANLFPTTPVVLGGIDQRQLRALALSSNDTAVASHYDLRAVTEIVVRLFPATTNLAIVLGNSPMEQFWMAECRQAWQPFTNRIDFLWLNDLPFPDMCRRVAHLPPGTAIGYGALQVDAAGVPHGGLETLEQLCAVANAPVFGLSEEQLGRGIVGGWLVSGATQGRAMARAAGRILRGELPESLPAPAIGPVPMFDWRELQRWQVDERQLPAGSVVRFRQPSVWAQYHLQILAALGVILMQAATIVALLVHRARRRRAEADLRANQQFMELATSAGELGLWVHHVPPGTMRASPRFCSIFGFPPDSLVRFEDVIARIHPADRSQAEAVLQGAARPGQAFERESRLLMPDGTERWISIKGMALLDDRGQPLRTQGVVLDRTAWHEAEMAAQRHRNELRHVGRVHVLGQLSSALAHELNQPLGAILSNAEAAELFLRNGPAALDEVRAILADIRRDDQRASDVIHRMRALLQRHEMDPTLLSPGSLIESCMALTRPDAIERRVTIACVVAPALPRVRGDRVHLQQVLLNLLLNGMDAMKDCPVETRRLAIEARRDGHQTVEFTVSDAGYGIPPDRLERVFESFFTTKPTGLGLGLSISRTIIEAHHGRIWAVNNPGGGATIHFTLPAEEPGEVPNREGEARHESAICG
ncbi:MAG: PAS domain-containing sensor histidine kinase [Lentisphaerae bacterium]|nr:PAS domain-containing sensor histidine kinase [Lentisphaerota bacterium]